jgi:16S rRNA G966 N2-methylase RsmD
MIDALATEVFFGDSFKIYPQIVQNLQKHDQKAYLYFDPPFDIRDGMSGIYDRVYSLIEDTPKEIVNMVIIEHSSKVKIPKSIGDFSLKKTKKFGKSSLSYFESEIL